MLSAVYLHSDRSCVFPFAAGGRPPSAAGPPAPVAVFQPQLSVSPACGCWPSVSNFRPPIRSCSSPGHRLSPPARSLPAAVSRRLQLSAHWLLHAALSQQPASVAYSARPPTAFGSLSFEITKLKTEKRKANSIKLSILPATTRQPPSPTVFRLDIALHWLRYRVGRVGHVPTQYFYFLTLRLWALHGKNRLQKAFVPLNIQRLAETLLLCDIV